MKLIYKHRDEIAKLIKFVMVSLFSIGLILFLTILLHEWIGIKENQAYAISLATAFVLNFLLIKFYTFSEKDRGDQHGSKKQLFLTIIGSIAARLFEFAMFAILTQITHVHYTVVMIFIHSASGLLKYLYYRSFVFRKI